MTDLLAHLSRLRTRRGRASTGDIALEGLRVVERALRAGADVDRIGTRGDALRGAWAQRVLEDALSRGVTVEPLEETAFDRFVGGRDLGGVVALARRPRVGSLPREWKRALVAVDIHDPGNVGALVRTALAGDVDAFIAVGETDPWHPRAIRTAMGSTFKLPILEVDDADALFSMVAPHETLAALTDGATALPDVVPPERLAVLMGSEAHGLPDAVAGKVGLRARIPMRADVDSYSVNAAAAVLLYALRPR